MTKYVRTNYVPERHKKLLTVGKLYEIIDEGMCQEIINDIGKSILIYLPHCAYLDDKSWEVVEINEEEEAKIKERELKVGDYVKVIKDEKRQFGLNSIIEPFVNKVYKIVSVKGQSYILDIPSNVLTYYFARDSLELVEGKIQQGCSHVDLILEYAKDCQKYKKPWLLWQHCEDGGIWEDFPEYYGHLMWNSKSHYRRRPSSININGFEVPEPLREVPKERIAVYLSWIYHKDYFIKIYWDNSNLSHQKWLARGLLHLLRESAIYHTKALLSFTEIPNVNN